MNDPDPLADNCPRTASVGGAYFVCPLCGRTKAPLVFDFVAQTVLCKACWR